MNLRIPYRDRSDALQSVADAARTTLGPDEVRIARQLVLLGAADGIRTAGALIDRVEGMTPEQRRALLDEARTAAGLPSTREIEAQQRRELQRPMIGIERRDQLGRAHQICPAPNCRSFPIDSVGAAAPHPAKRWWCPEHRAGHETDMEPWQSTLRFGPGGGLELGEEVEAEADRQRAAAERRAADQSRRRSAAQAQLPASTAEREAARRAWTPDNLKLGAPT